MSSYKSVYDTDFLRIVFICYITENGTRTHQSAFFNDIIHKLNLWITFVCLQSISEVILFRNCQLPFHQCFVLSIWMCILSQTHVFSFKFKTERNLCCSRKWSDIYSKWICKINKYNMNFLLVLNMEFTRAGYFSLAF